MLSRDDLARPVHHHSCVNTLIEASRLRKQFLAAETRLTLQIKALQRLMGQRQTVTPHCGADIIAAAACVPLIEARNGIREHRKVAEHRLVTTAKTLSVYPWILGTRGCGALGFGLIIGEAGDLWNYANPAKLWKRMALAVIGDHAQRRIKGKTKALKRAATEQGFSPRRRQLMYNIGDALMKLNDGEYRRLYDDRKAHELARGCTRLHAHRRALRYMEKRFLLHLWREWRRAEPRETDALMQPEPLLSPAQPVGAGESLHV